MSNAGEGWIGCWSGAKHELGLLSVPPGRSVRVGDIFADESVKTFRPF
jgi:hypothetical protein